MWSAALLEPARVAWLQQVHDRLAGPSAAVVDEPHQRVVAERLLPGCGGVLLLGVRQRSTPSRPPVTRPPASGAASPANCQIGSRTSTRAARIAARARLSLAVRCEGADEPGDGRAGGHRPEQGRLGPQVATSARQSPPKATARATSSRILPGSRTARAFRHGAGADRRSAPGADRAAGNQVGSGRTRHTTLPLIWPGCGSEALFRASPGPASSPVNASAATAGSLRGRSPGRPDLLQEARETRRVRQPLRLVRPSAALGRHPGSTRIRKSVAAYPTGVTHSHAITEIEPEPKLMSKASWTCSGVRMLRVRRARAIHGKASGLSCWPPEPARRGRGPTRAAGTVGGPARPDECDAAQVRNILQASGAREETERMIALPGRPSTASDGTGSDKHTSSMVAGVRRCVGQRLSRKTKHEP